MEANRIRNNWRNMVNWMNRNEWNFCKSQKCVALCATEKSIGNALFDFNSTENENLFSAITFTPTFSMLSSIFELQKKIYFFSIDIFFVSNSFPKNEINRFLIERYKWPMKDEKRFDMKWCNWFHKLNMVLAHSNPFRFFFLCRFLFRNWMSTSTEQLCIDKLSRCKQFIRQFISVNARQHICHL